MSTSAVSTSSLYQELQSYFSTRKSDVQQLGQALQSGNLADAQAAYSTITTLGKGGPFASGDPFRLSQREQAFAAVGQALQSGDLAGAQQAFAQLTSGQGPKAANPPIATPVSTSGPEIILNLSSGSGAANPPPVGTPVSTSGTAANPPLGTPITSNGPEIILNLSSGSGAASASPEQITINISQPSQSGSEQVSLSIGNQQGSNAQEITFNLNPNSQEQIVINLLQGSFSSATPATAPASTTASGGINVSA
jgi:hypothetical protein